MTEPVTVDEAAGRLRELIESPPGQEIPLVRDGYVVAMLRCMPPLLTPEEEAAARAEREAAVRAILALREEVSGFPDMESFLQFFESARGY